MCVLLYIRSYSGLATKIFIAIATVKIWQLIKEIDEMHASCPVSGKLKNPNKTLNRSWNWTVRWMHCIWLTFIWPWTDLDIRLSHKIQHLVVLKHMQAPDMLKVLMKFEKGDSYEKILMFMILQYHVLALSRSLMSTKTNHWKAQWFDITVVQKGHPLRGLGAHCSQGRMWY